MVEMVKERTDKLELGEFNPVNEPRQVVEGVVEEDRGSGEIASLVERQEMLTKVARQEFDRYERYPALYKPGAIIGAVDVMNKADGVYREEPKLREGGKLTIIILDKSRSVLELFEGIAERTKRIH